MKTAFFFLILVILKSNILTAGGRRSAEFGVCNDMAMSLDFRLNHENKELPNTWDDFEMIRVMKKGTMKHQLFSAKTINSFALVPGAPEIKPQTGIPYEYPGYRLVFISREGGRSKSSGIGRYALLADPGGKNSKQFPVYSVFFPENLAQIIIKQIDGFNPKNQPLAFDDLTPFEREDKEFRKNNFRGFDNLSISQSRESGAAPLVSFWNMFFLALLLLLVWCFWIKRRHNKRFSCPKK